MDSLLREYLPILIFIGIAFGVGHRDRARLLRRGAPEARCREAVAL